MCKKNYLNNSAKWYDSNEGFKQDWGTFHKYLMSYRFDTIKPWLNGDYCLEFGTADGESTQYLFKHFKKVIAVEGAEHFAKKVNKRFLQFTKQGHFELYISLFEDFVHVDKFDVVLALHILEHLKNPIDFLKHASTFVKSNGVLIIMVPNAQSIHRLAAVKMHLLEKSHSLNPQDIKLGHTRVYYPDELTQHICAAGLDIIEQGGIFFKPLTNKQIQDNWNKQMMDGFYELGKDFPEYAAEIYAVCRIPDN